MMDIKDCNVKRHLLLYSRTFEAQNGSNSQAPSFQISVSNLRLQQDPVHLSEIHPVGNNG